MFYCRKDMIRSGVGPALYEAVESKAIGLRLQRIFTEASITARPFFEHCGFAVCQQLRVTRGGVELSNFRMEKRLPASLR